MIASLSPVVEKRPENRHPNTPEDRTTLPATGLLLIFPTLFIHYLEVTNAAMRQILDDLNQSIHHPHGLVREASILNISYNVRSSWISFRGEQNISLLFLSLDSNSTLFELVFQKHQISCRRSWRSTSRDRRSHRARNSRQTPTISTIPIWRTATTGNHPTHLRSCLFKMIHSGTNRRCFGQYRSATCGSVAQSRYEQGTSNRFVTVVCLVSINYLLKQPIFRTPEDLLKNYTRPINIRFESGKNATESTRYWLNCAYVWFRFDCAANTSPFPHYSLICSYLRVSFLFINKSWVNWQPPHCDGNIFHRENKLFTPRCASSRRPSGCAIRYRHQSLLNSTLVILLLHTGINFCSLQATYRHY